MPEGSIPAAWSKRSPSRSASSSWSLLYLNMPRTRAPSMPEARAPVMSPVTAAISKPVEPLFDHSAGGMPFVHMLKLVRKNTGKLFWRVCGL